MPEGTGRPGDPEHPDFCSLRQLRCSWGLGSGSGWWGGGQDVGHKFGTDTEVLLAEGCSPPQHTDFAPGAAQQGEDRGTVF